MKLAEAPLDAAKSALIMLIRRAARRRIWGHAVSNYIMDFEDALLVEQVHRDFKSGTIATGTSLVVQTNAALTKAELLPIFNIIEPWLE